MPELVDLLVDAGVHLVVAVADADRDNAAKEIEVLIAIRIPDVLVLGMVNHQRLLEVVKNGREEKLLVRENDFFFGHGRKCLSRRTLVAADRLREERRKLLYRVLRRHARSKVKGSPGTCRGTIH